MKPFMIWLVVVVLVLFAAGDNARAQISSSGYWPIFSAPSGRLWAAASPELEQWIRDSIDAVWRSNAQMHDVIFQTNQINQRRWDNIDERHIQLILRIYDKYPADVDATLKELGLRVDLIDGRVIGYTGGQQ